MEICCPLLGIKQTDRQTKCCKVDAYWSEVTKMYYTLYKTSCYDLPQFILCQGAFFNTFFMMAE